jgi:hypothetical protein
MNIAGSADNAYIALYMAFGLTARQRKISIVRKRQGFVEGHREVPDPLNLDEMILAPTPPSHLEFA